MSVAQDYKRQYSWRAWETLYAAAPMERGQTVLDLGCGVGDQAAALARRGAHVIGVDANEELLAEARARAIDPPGAVFHTADLRDPPDLGRVADGLWCSFAAAYFTDLPGVLGRWRRLLKPGAWALLIEIDDLFGHEPLSAPARAALDAYADESLAAGRYDFRMGRRLRGCLEESGFVVTREFSVPDQELSFSGAAAAEVIEGWRARLARMKLLQDRCGPSFPRVRDEFLACLALPDHRSTARVVCCAARLLA